MLDKGLKDFDIDTIISLIKKEDKYQIEKWGYQDYSLELWYLFIAEETGEVSKAISEYLFRGGTKFKIIRELIQVITLSMKMVMMLKKGDKDKVNIRPVFEKLFNRHNLGEAVNKAIKEINDLYGR